MKKQSLLILLIILAGSSASIVYATGTVITNTGITTGDLTVTGTCTGCGGDGSFTTYSLVLNETVAGTSGVFNTGGQVHVGTNGDTIASDDTPIVAIVLLNGTVSSTSSLTTLEPQKLSDQSSGGTYNIYSDGTSVNVFKHKINLQTITIDTTHSFQNGIRVSVGISSDGKYITIYGDDVGNSQDHIQVWRGS